MFDDYGNVKQTITNSEDDNDNNKVCDQVTNCRIG